MYFYSFFNLFSNVPKIGKKSKLLDLLKLHPTCSCMIWQGLAYGHRSFSEGDVKSVSGYPEV